jgi:hypothetical protein
VDDRQLVFSKSPKVWHFCELQEPAFALRTGMAYRRNRTPGRGYEQKWEPANLGWPAGRQDSIERRAGKRGLPIQASKRRISAAGR